MTDRPLDNLSREELIVLVQSLQQQLRQRTLVMAEAGSIAHAAMELNDVFQASQRAADQYLESAEALKARQEADYNRRLAQAEEQCREMVAQAEESAQFYWDALNRRIEELMASQTLPLETAEPTEEVTADSFGPDD